MTSFSQQIKPDFRSKYRLRRNSFEPFSTLRVPKKVYVHVPQSISSLQYLIIARPYRIFSDKWELIRSIINRKMWSERFWQISASLAFEVGTGIPWWSMSSQLLSVGNCSCEFVIVDSETIYSLLLLLEHGNAIFPDIIVLRTTETIQKWTARLPLTAQEKQTYRNL